MAVAGGDIVGACLAFAYPAMGWVRQFAVDEAWRRKGTGTALLCHAFGIFQKRGYDRAGLTVEADRGASAKISGPGYRLYRPARIRYRAC